MLKEDLQPFYFFKTYFIDQGMDPQWAHFLNLGISLLLLGLLLLLVSFLTKRFVLKAYNTFTSSTKTSFDDFLVQSNFPRYLSYLIPLFILIIAVPVIFEGFVLRTVRAHGPPCLAKKSIG